MPVHKQNQPKEVDITEKQWKSIYKFGGVAALVVIFGSLLDIVISMSLGGGISAIPQTAIGRFAQFHDNWLIGLYYLDLLNVTTSIIMIPTFFALFAAHRRVNIPYAAFAMILSFIGSTIFITNNTALPMLALSSKYAAATTEAQKTLLAAAGEAMLARGAHGTPGVFLGFLLPIVASFIMSMVMLKGKIFNKTTAYLGILGSILLFIYIIFVTFVPAIKNVVMILAMPGGLLTMAWMLMITIRLFQLGRLKNS